MLNGRISLTTPEGVRLLLTPAGPVVRAWAWAVDTIIYGMLVGFLAVVFGTSKFGQGFYLLGLFLCYWAYPVICEVYFGGRTVGKLVMGILVLRADGLPVRWRESVLRNLLLVADFLPFLYLSGLLCMLFDTQFRRLGDIVAGTQVVYAESQKQTNERVALVDVEPLPLPYPLSPQQQRVLIGLFEREKQLPKGRMTELGDLAAPLTGLTAEASVNRLRSFVAGLTQ